MLLVVTGNCGILPALTGGGGSIVCVPLLLYMVKVPDTHLIIGTSAMSVAINALINLAAHAAKGNVRWQTGVVVSLVAVMGALAGSQMGKITDGHYPAFLPVDAGCRRIDAERNHLAGTPLPSPMLPFIPPSYGPASSLWAGWRAFWALAAIFGCAGAGLVFPLFDG